MPRRKFVEDEAREMASLYSGGETLDSVAEAYGLCANTVGTWIARVGVSVRPHASMTPDQIAESDELYRVGFSTISIGQHFGVTQQTVATNLQKRGVVLHAPGGRRHLPLLEDAFDSITPTSAYWVGMLATDGCVTGSGGLMNEVKLALKFEDHDHVSDFKSFLGSGHKLRLCSCRHPTDDEVLLNRCMFSVKSIRLAAALAKYGVVPRKTYTLVAKGGVELMPNFWAGVYDGDGHDGIHSSIEGPIGQLKLSGASEPFIIQCRDFLASNGVRGSHSIIVEQPNGSSLAKRPKYIVSLTGRSALDAVALLYVGRTPILARKAKAAAEMVLLGAHGGIVGTKREAWNHPQRDRAIAWAKSYLDGERALRAAA